MAGDWIKMRNDLRGDPAVLSIAAATKLDEDAVVGKLHRLWVWADEQTVDGNAPVTLVCAKRFVDRHVGVTGFADAMVAAGWLVLENDRLVFPDFEKHNGQSGKRRALTARRVSMSRARKRNAASVTKCVPREEKRREEIPLPLLLNEPKFVESWECFKLHRIEKRSKMTPTAESKALAKLERMGLTRAIAALEHSMANGYTGIFEPGSKNGDTAGSQPKPDTRKLFK